MKGKDLLSWCLGLLAAAVLGGCLALAARGLAVGRGAATGTAVDTSARQEAAPLSWPQKAGREAPGYGTDLAQNLPCSGALPLEPQPGEPVAVGLALPLDMDPGGYRAALLDSRGRVLSRAAFFSLGNEAGAEFRALAAVLAVPSTAMTGPATIRVEPAVEGLGDISIMIGERSFVAEEIYLDQRNTEIRTVPDPQKTAESEQLTAILYTTGAEVYTWEAWLPPVAATRRTSFYGDRRVYRYSTGGSATSIHAGVDYGVPTGTEVRSSAAGKVVLAQFRISTGNSVVIEHLPGVYSIYYHMDSIAAQEGAMVEAGELLGLSGATGLATGPHLHWEIRVSGENADPDAFTQRPVLDKTAIFRILRKSLD
ncbi:MAG: M23 family metallopeptidase [Treponema sp.]|nr:M23 family metallopeptidase [Treponema sp.]